MESAAGFAFNTSDELVLGLAGTSHGGIETRRRLASRGGPGPAEEVGLDTTFVLPEGRDGGTILELDDKIVLDGKDVSDPGLVGGVGDRHVGLSEVGGPLTLRVSLVNL